jgi:hypothetical protein
MPLAQFESLALTLEAQGLAVDDDWNASPSPLPQYQGYASLADPKWTEKQCRGPTGKSSQ